MSKKPSWETIKIADIAAPKKFALAGGPFGSNLVSRDYKPSGVPVIRGSNLSTESTFSFEDFVFVSEEKANTLLPNNAHPGDLVFTQRGTLGQVGLIPKECEYNRFVISQSQMKLTVDETKADPYFVYFYFRSPSTIHAIQNRTITSGVPHINLEILRNFEIPLPLLVTQKRIAEILSNYDRLIDNNTRRIALLEKSIHRLYKEWFVHLRFPGCDRVKIVDGVPEEWIKTTADQMIEFNPKTLAPKGEEHPFVPMDSLSTNLMTIAQIDSRPIGGGAKFKNGDTLLARITPCLENGKTAFVQFMDEPETVASGSTEFIVMRSKQVTPSWVYCLARSYHFRQHAINSMAGSDGRQRVKPEALKQFQLSLPSPQVLREFDEVVVPIFRQIHLLNSQTRKLREARDLLLPRLMNGSIAV